MTNQPLLFRPENIRIRGTVLFVRIYGERETPIAFLRRFRKTRRHKWIVTLELASGTALPTTDLRTYVETLCTAADAYQWPSDG